jgi:small-conductance mechanosensitive channel
VSRFQVDIGVDYATNVLELMNILKAVAKTTPRVLEMPQPFVRFENFGESSLDFSVYFYTTDIFRAENIKSDMRVEIYKALKAKGINIPFPQREIRMKNDGENTPIN